MIIQKILNYFKGYVTIKVEGFFIERFINMCRSKKIKLIDIRRDKATIMYAKIGVSDYKKIRQVAKKTKAKVKVENKKGLPFKIHKYRKRKIFAVLFLFVILGIIIFSNYIWNIEITGNVNISKAEIIASLDQNGLAIGKSKNDIDINSIINGVRLNRDDIAWIGITIKGTNAIIKIKEVQKAPEVIDENKFCNIISEKTAMITKINVQNGTAGVKEGQIVEKGEVLVHGYLEGQYTGTRYVHSIADIEAKVWYTKKVKEPLIQEIKLETGNTENKYSIKIKKNQINLFKTLSKFEKYDTINASKKLELFPNFYLPIEFITTTNKEYELVQKEYSEEELKSILTDKIKEELLQEIPNPENIVNTNVNVYFENGFVEIEVTYEVLENIGIKQEINI